MNAARNTLVYLGRNACSISTAVTGTSAATKPVVVHNNFSNSNFAENKRSIITHSTSTGIGIFSFGSYSITFSSLAISGNCFVTSDRSCNGNTKFVSYPCITLFGSHFIGGNGPSGGSNVCGCNNTINMGDNGLLISNYAFSNGCVNSNNGGSGERNNTVNICNTDCIEVVKSSFGGGHLTSIRGHSINNNTVDIHCYSLARVVKYAFAAGCIHGTSNTGVCNNDNGRCRRNR